MDRENYPDSDADDSDFVPDEKEYNVSEDSDSGAENSEDEKMTRSNIKKNTKKKQKSKNEEVVRNNSKADEQKEEENTDSLWEKFLSDTSSTKNKSDESSNLQNQNEEKKVNIQNISNNLSSSENKDIAVNSDSKSSVKSEMPTVSGSNKNQPPLLLPKIGAKRSGLSSVLNQVNNKKQKKSILEQSKQDWNQFKAEENIQEELTTFNRGKNGFLERQDFLSRTDLRQFEIEKKLRGKY